MVVGLTTMDVVSSVSDLDSSIQRPGGKGLNQAVAMARLGGNVSLVSALGDDRNAMLAYHAMGVEGINTRYVTRVRGQQHVIEFVQSAAGPEITRVGRNSRVDEALRNAFAQVTRDDIPSPQLLSITFEAADDVIEAVWNYVTKVRSSGCTVLLVVNPAPLLRRRSQAVLDGLRHVDVLVPNQAESAVLLGTTVADPVEAALEIRIKYGVRMVCITLGDGGVAFAGPGSIGHLPAMPVEPVDPIAASDIFVGALATSLKRTGRFFDSVVFGVVCAGLSVSRLGGLQSAPSLADVKSFLTNSKDFASKQCALAVLEELS